MQGGGALPGWRRRCLPLAPLGRRRGCLRRGEAGLQLGRGGQAEGLCRGARLCPPLRPPLPSLRRRPSHCARPGSRRARARARSPPAPSCCATAGSPTDAREAQVGQARGARARAESARLPADQVLGDAAVAPLAEDILRERASRGLIWAEGAEPEPLSSQPEPLSSLWSGPARRRHPSPPPLPAALAALRATWRGGRGRTRPPRTWP